MSSGGNGRVGGAGAPDGAACGDGGIVCVVNRFNDLIEKYEAGTLLG